MRALVKKEKGPGHMALLDVEEPAPGPGQVQVRVVNTGICGTDLHIASGQFFHYFPPLILGHEFSGVLSALGPGVHGLSVGERVTAEPTKGSCGRCPHCREGSYNRCDERDIAGVVSDGAFANFIVTRPESIHRLPEGVSFRAAALSEPLAVSVHGMREQCSLARDDKVLVVGPGTIGLCCAQVALASGARVMVAGISRDAHRLSLIRSLGAERVLDVERESLADAVGDWTGGTGVHLAVEAAGAGAAFDSCLDAVRKGGQILQVGLPVRPVEVKLERLAWKEVRLVGTFGQKRSAWLTAIGLMAEEKVDMEAMVSDVMPLEEWEAGFQKMERGEGVKVLLKPSEA